MTHETFQEFITKVDNMGVNDGILLSKKQLHLRMDFVIDVRILLLLNSIFKYAERAH